MYYGERPRRHNAAGNGTPLDACTAMKTGANRADPEGECRKTLASEKRETMARPERFERPTLRFVVCGIDFLSLTKHYYD